MTTVIPQQIKVQPEANPSIIQAANFSHLYQDVAWFGVAFGSTLSFLAVFAARLGATGWQLGLLTAGPALISILFTFPGGHWLAKHPLGWAVTKTAFWQRLGFFLLIPLPLVLPVTFQIWIVLLLVLLMAIPGTALAVGFNALLATAVPPEARGRVIGRRNALLAGAIVVVFLLSGWILDQLPFTWGYATVFAIGALGAGLSTYHLSRIRVSTGASFQGRPLADHAQPGRSTGFNGSLGQRMSIGLRLWLRWRPGRLNILGHISGRYRGAMGAFFLFHFTQLLPAALFPLFWVYEASLTDGEIGWINAIFYLTMLAASPLLAPLTARLGNYRLSTSGAILLALYPLFVALSTDIVLLIVASVVGGLVWAIFSGALLNRIMELTPDDDRPAHFALYNLVLNIATLFGTMLGPFMADWIGLREALLLIALLRIGSGVIMVRWG